MARILTISNCPLVESQGSGYVILNFAERLRRKGHIVDLRGPEACEVFRFFRKAKWHRISWGMAWLAIREVFKKDYDVVEFYGAESWLAVSWLCRLQGRRFLLVQHSNGIEPLAAQKTIENLGSVSLDGDPLKWYQRLLKVPAENAFTKVDGLVTVSRCDADYALAKGYQPQERIVAIDNALPEDLGT